MMEIANSGAKINALYNEAMAYASKANATMMEVGNLLNLERENHTTVSWSKWRKTNINFSQSHCRRLMAVAKEFGHLPEFAMVSIGTLEVLLTADKDLQQEVAQRSLTTDPMTRQDVTTQKKLDDLAKGVREDLARADAQLALVNEQLAQMRS